MAKKPRNDSLPTPSPEAQIVLEWDLTEFRYPGVYLMSYKSWQVAATPGIPHGVRYAFNLFAPNAQGEPINPILRFDNEHPPEGIKAPFDHWHPPKRGPGGQPIGVGKERQLKDPLNELPILFFEKGTELLASMGVDVNQVVQTQAPSRLSALVGDEDGSDDSNALNTEKSRAKQMKPRRTK